MRLIADCGNTALKLALAHDGGIWLQERLPAEPVALDAFLAQHGGGVTDLALLPGAAAGAALVGTWWTRAGKGRPLRRVGDGIPVPEVGQYATLGLDRICAGLAGVAQEQRDLVVIDCGTATTLSAWRHVPGAPPAQGARFLGGLILPGARACLAGLAAGAPALPLVEPAVADASALQRDTAGALAAGIGIGYGGMVGACAQRLCRESGIADVLCTGGAAPPLLGDVLPRRSYRPTLVVEGVELLCRSAPAA